MLMKFRFPLSVIALVAIIFVWKTILFKNNLIFFPNTGLSAPEDKPIFLNIVKVKGQARFEGKALKEKDIIFRSGVLTTSEKSVVVLAFGDDLSSEIKIFPGSSIDITDLKAKQVKPNENLEFNINQGAAVFKFYNPSKTKTLNVKTPTMVMRIRGATFIAQVTDGKSVLLVQEGRVEVDSSKSKPEVAERGSGFEARLPNELQPIDPGKYNLDWNSKEQF